MDQQNVKENKQQAAFWRKRLNWYLNEATTEEYNEEEVQAIMDLLRVLDPEGAKEDYYSPEKSLERFWQTYEMRERIQKEFERLQAGEVTLADYPDEELDEKKPAKKPAKKYRIKHFTKFVTAAALVVAMFLGGTIGIYADRDGLFRKVNTGKDKDTVVSSSTNTGLEGYKSFEKIEDVPVKYLSCLWTPSNIPESLSLYQVELTEGVLTIKTNCKFGDKNKFINTTKLSFKEGVVASDKIYDGFVFHCKIQYNSVEVEYLKKENKDYVEYVALFKNENCVYELSSNCDFLMIENVIKESLATGNL